MAAIIAWIKALFIAKPVGILVGIFAKYAASVIVKEVMDPENQRKAYEFVKELNADKTLTNKQKQAMFNKKMLAFGKKIGKKFTSGIVNCLREFAVVAVKAESNIVSTASASLDIRQTKTQKKKTIAEKTAKRRKI